MEINIKLDPEYDKDGPKKVLATIKGTDRALCILNINDFLRKEYGKGNIEEKLLDSIHNITEDSIGNINDYLD